MKNLIINISLIFLVLLGCENDDSIAPIDQLPPLTTEGKNTIGCLVDGRVFKTSGIMNNFYQFVDGNYFLVINWESSKQIEFGQIALSKIKVEEGKKYSLKFSPYLEEDFTGGAGTYAINTTSLSGQYETDQNHLGEIYFLKFDEQNGIMSGTFQFIAKDIFSERTVSITDGRFDLKFTN